MKALVLAAGFGTRLAPTTEVLPKPLFPVAGQPVLGRMISQLKAAGCEAVAVNVHHLAHRIEAYLSQTDFGLPVRISHETEILGTGGALRRLADFWDDRPFLVVNADIVTDIDFSRVYRHHRSGRAMATLVMHDRPPFNQVWVDEKNHVTGFARFAGGVDHHSHQELAFTGIHVIEPAMIDHLPASGFCDIISVYQQLIDAGSTINAHVVTGHYWQDMGNPQSYRQVVVDAMAPGVFHSAFGGRRPSAVDCHPLCGDGSDRAWFRLSDGPHQLILADHGIALPPSGSEWNAFIQIGRHLFLSGLPVPRIYAHDAFSGLVFLEDLGDCHLQQAVNRASGRGAIEAIYRPVIDIWIDLTSKAAGTFDPSWTCQSPAYDAALILDKECRYFVDAFLNGYLDLGVDYSNLENEFSRLARATMDNAIDGLIHRDFQSRNIMLKNGRPYLIDFQGARRGPIQYDLASLLIDPYVGLDAALQERLLADATDSVVKSLGCDPMRFIRGYHCCVVTRNLQMLGAFGHLTRVKNKPAFETWIPIAAKMLCPHLKRIEDLELPGLHAIARQIGRLRPSERPFHRKSGT